VPVKTAFQYKGYQVEITGDPSAPTITAGGKDYTPFYKGSDLSPEMWIIGHIDSQLPSRLEFRLRDQALANAANGWKAEENLSGRVQTVLSATNKQVLVRIAYCCWYIGSPVLAFAFLPHVFEIVRDGDYALYTTLNTDLSRFLSGCIMLATWIYTPLIVRKLLTGRKITG